MQGKKIIFFLISRWPIHNSNLLDPFLSKIEGDILIFLSGKCKSLNCFPEYKYASHFFRKPQFQNGQFSGRKTEIEGHLKEL